MESAIRVWGRKIKELVWLVGDNWILMPLVVFIASFLRMKLKLKPLRVARLIIIFDGAT